MATIGEVRKLAREMGVTVEYDRSIGHLEAIAPAGKWFCATNCHSCCHHFERGPWHSECLGDLLEDLREGLEECQAEDCDICSEAAAEGVL